MKFMVLEFCSLQKMKFVFFEVFKGCVFFWGTQKPLFRKVAPTFSIGRMTTRVGAFESLLFGEHFHNLSCGHTTSRKFSTGARSPDPNFLACQKT